MINVIRYNELQILITGKFDVWALDFSEISNNIDWELLSSYTKFDKNLLKLFQKNVENRFLIITSFGEDFVIWYEKDNYFNITKTNFNLYIDEIIDYIKSDCSLTEIIQMQML